MTILILMKIVKGTFHMIDVVVVVKILATSLVFTSLATILTDLAQTRQIAHLLVKILGHPAKCFHLAVCQTATVVGARLLLVICLGVGIDKIIAM